MLKTGFSLVEIIVATALFTGSVAVFIAAFEIFNDLSRHTIERTDAGMLLEEGAEAVQLLRDLGWETSIVPLALETPYYLYWDGSTYQATTTSMLINGRYTRTIELNSAYRNASDQLADSGILDEDTRRVMIRIYNRDNVELSAAPSLIHNVYDIE